MFVKHISGLKFMQWLRSTLCSVLNSSKLSIWDSKKLLKGCIYDRITLATSKVRINSLVKSEFSLDKVFLSISIEVLNVFRTSRTAGLWYWKASTVLDLEFQRVCESDCSQCCFACEVRELQFCLHYTSPAIYFGQWRRCVNSEGFQD